MTLYWIISKKGVDKSPELMLLYAARFKDSNLASRALASCVGAHTAFHSNLHPDPCNNVALRASHHHRRPAMLTRVDMLTPNIISLVRINGLACEPVGV